MQTTIVSRNQEVILAEAADIMRNFHAPGMKHQPKDPTVVAKLIALREESGLPVSTFCYKVRCSESVFHMWSGGCNSSGKPWPKLAEALALRKGTALAAAMSVELGQGKPATPAQVSASEELQAAGASLLAELGGKPPRPPGSKRKKASVDTRAVGDIRIVSIEDSGVIVRERVEVVREEIAPGTPEHTAILRDLYKRTHH